MCLNRLLAFLAVAAGLSAQNRQVQPVIAHRQVALVIGNDSYANYPQLKNSVNDARAVSARLRELHYDVSTVLNANRKAMALAIDQFLNKLSAGDVALFYYSGHGVQVESENYLLSVDFDGQNEVDVKYDTQAAGKIQERMEKSGAQLNIVILDACRNNPFHGTGNRSAERGLAPMNPRRGTFIAFATAPGSTASDNPNGRNGLFTQYLLDALSEPGLGLNDVFDLVREKVDAASGGKQLPWTQSSVVGRYAFVPAETVTVVRGPRPGQVRVNPTDGQKYVWIPPGRFMMGCSPGDTECGSDEKPAREVEVPGGLWLGQTPVTVGAWKKYRAATGQPALSSADTYGRKLNEAAGDDNLPAVAMTWNEGKNYCEWSGGRLPTEAEWEYAARAGSTAARYGNLDSIAWYGDNSGRQRIDSADIWRKDPANYNKRLFENGNGPHPIAEKLPNSWNLYDMLGNVFQWTADWYEEGKTRSLRGGSCYFIPRGVRASFRDGYGPEVRNGGIGLRCVGN